MHFKLVKYQGSIYHPCESTHLCAALVRNILYFSRNGGCYSCTYVIREANQAPDALVKYGLSLDDQSRIFLC